jgi:hypothetical protein
MLSLGSLRDNWPESIPCWQIASPINCNPTADRSCARYNSETGNIHVSLIEPGPIASKFRLNAVKALEKYVDIENSFHREKYQGVLGRLNKPGPAVPFTLPPRSCAETRNPCA